ncbi:hypothetical protein B0H17DRAFT_924714 [Mycena rosella]|uniref:HAT C-terminal dimerisation domain-containing protein n=1 Tax=Mycena rosella TaxID=1033263 RepID=A0AAD7DW42_MYCRO|nr:hypothetical protein B0H17DRAFT_924714 [Mycena rosella]
MTCLTLHRISRDYLAIQSSATPAEHAFSSRSLTDTKCRNRLNPTLFEALQLLKVLIAMAISAQQGSRPGTLTLFLRSSTTTLGMMSWWRMVQRPLKLCLIVPENMCMVPLIYFGLVQFNIVALPGHYELRGKKIQFGVRTRSNPEPNALNLNARFRFGVQQRPEPNRTLPSLGDACETEALQGVT